VCILLRALYYRNKQTWKPKWTPQMAARLSHPVELYLPRPRFSPPHKTGHLRPFFLSSSHLPPPTAMSTDCPILIWMISLNREYTREVYMSTLSLQYSPSDPTSFRRNITPATKSSTIVFSTSRSHTILAMSIAFVRRYSPLRR
jgi:hypothetical protein